MPLLDHGDQVIDHVKQNPNYVYLDPQKLPIEVDLKYATPVNFLDENIYGSFNEAFLQKEAYAKFLKALDFLRRERPHYRFLVYDALRPRRFQWIMWEKVVGTAQEKYVADPNKGSMHNYGLAIDLTILDEKGVPLDMGSGFDQFDILSEPQLEKELFEQGCLDLQAMENRKLLRGAMEGAGFWQLPHEWWHFNAHWPPEEVPGKFEILE